MRAMKFVNVVVEKYRFRRVSQDLDEFVNSPSDYSIILKRLPEGTTQKDINDMIDNRRGFLEQEQKVVTENLHVQKIIMSYDLTEFNQQRNSYLRRFKEMISEGQTKDFSKPKLSQPTIPASLAIVVFLKQQSKQFFIQQPKCNQRVLHYFFSPLSPLSDQRVKDQRVCIQRAPEPDDILWNNGNVTVCQGISRKIVLGTFSFILLMGGGLAQYGIALIQKDITEDTKRILIGTLASVVVTITNLILQYFLIYTTYWQKMNTVTQYMDVLTFKLVFQQFLNAGLFIVAANILANYETFNLQGNLSETIIQIMILNAITPNISNFLVYRFDIGGRLMRYFCLQKKCSIYTQLEANHLSVLPEPFLPEKYSYIIKTVWLTVFYAPFTPVVVPISIIGLIINYFVEKYLFGASYSAPNMISGALNNSCIELFEYVPLILSIGEFLIYMYFKRFSFKQVPINWSLPIYISIGISVINLIIPMRQVNMAICKIQPDLSNQPSYSKAQKEFQVTYELTNPAYQTNRSRLWDVKMWKKMFGHAPDTYLRQMSQFTQYSNNTNRQMMYPFIHQNDQKQY